MPAARGAARAAQVLLPHGAGRAALRRLRPGRARRARLPVRAPGACARPPLLRASLAAAPPLRACRSAGGSSSSICLRACPARWASPQPCTPPWAGQGASSAPSLRSHARAAAATARVRHGYRARRQVLGLYAGRQWAFIEEHLHGVLGQRRREAGDAAGALRHYAAMLACPRAPHAWQATYMRQFLDAVAAAAAARVRCTRASRWVSRASRWVSVGGQHRHPVCPSGSTSEHATPRLSSNAASAKPSQTQRS